MLQAASGFITSATHCKLHHANSTKLYCFMCILGQVKSNQKSTSPAETMQLQREFYKMQQHQKVVSETAH